MTEQMVLEIMLIVLLLGAGLGFTNLYRQSIENKRAYVVKITKASGRVVYGVRSYFKAYVGSSWDLEEHDTPEEAQSLVDRINDKTTIKTERYNP